MEYVSTLAQAQRAVTAQAIKSFTSDVGMLAKAIPTVLDKIDFEQAVDELASIAGVPAKMVRSDSEVAALRLHQELKKTKGERSVRSIQRLQKPLVVILEVANEAIILKTLRAL